MVTQGFYDSFAMFYEGFIGAVGFGKGLGLLTCQRVLVFCQHSLIDYPDQLRDSNIRGLRILSVSCSRDP